jgi:hypothetical protein
MARTLSSITEPSIKTPEQARNEALTKALESKEFIGLTTSFNKRLETWDGETPIEQETSFNSLANNLFAKILATGGWKVVRATRRESDMRGDTYDKPIFNITEASKYNITDKQ